MMHVLHHQHFAFYHQQLACGLCLAALYTYHVSSLWALGRTCLDVDLCMVLVFFCFSCSVV